MQTDGRIGRERERERERERNYEVSRINYCNYYLGKHQKTDLDYKDF
jgi:hypothetical protein